MLLGVSDLISLPLPRFWENTDSFLSASVSVVLPESKETLESAWRLQNEGLPLWTCAATGSRASLGNYSVLLICANYTTASCHGSCWDSHAWQGYYRTQRRTPWSEKNHKPQERRSGWLNANANYVWTDFFPPAHQNNWWVNEKARCPGVASYGGSSLTTRLLTALIKTKMLLWPSTHSWHLSNRWADS